MNNLLGPYSVPVAFSSPRVEGFLGTPRNALADPGWGEPFVDSQGNPITPGTPGGKNPAAMVLKRDGQWRQSRNSKRQRVGAISWRGKHKGGDSTKPRHILTYHGPSARLFPTQFTYGSSSDHRHVYTMGGIAAIAPGAVLGACLKSISQDANYLIVVCRTPEGELVLQRKYTGAYFGSDDEEMRKLAAFATHENPGGWVQIGVVPASEHGVPRTPWFFNESGTEAQCMRPVIKTAYAAGVAYDEEAYDRFRLQVFDGSVLFTNEGNKPPFTFSENGWHTDKGLWTTPVWTDGYVHYWQEMTIGTIATTKGEQVVAVDYDGDEEVLVYCVCDTRHRVDQDYMKGVDDDYYASGQPPTYRNSRNDRERYYNIDAMGVNPEHGVGDHRGSTWFAGGTSTYLRIERGSVEYQIPIETASTLTELEYIGYPYDPAFPQLFFRYYEVQYIRHLDIRAGGFVVLRLDSFEELTQQNTLSTVVGEAYDVDFTDKDVTTYMMGTRQNAPFAAQYHRHIGQYGDAHPRNVWDEVKAYGGAVWSWNGTNYTGARPTDNDEGQIGKLPVNSWFPEQSKLYRHGWYGMKLLFHDFSQETAGFCRREDKTFILSGELPDPDGGVPVPFVVSEPDSLSASLDGAMFYPLGEI